MNLVTMKRFHCLVFHRTNLHGLWVILVVLTEERSTFQILLLGIATNVRISFAKNDEAMKKHLKICAAREGITYSFNNGLIITFQGNFKISRGCSIFWLFWLWDNDWRLCVFFGPKMFVVSYCQIYLFHPSLNLDKIIIFWSF